MPYGKYPERVKAFKEWSNKQVNDSKLSGSATPGKAKHKRARRPRRRKSPKSQQE